MAVKTNECSIRGKSNFLFGVKQQVLLDLLQFGPIVEQLLLEADAVLPVKQQKHWFWSITEGWHVRISTKLQEEEETPPGVWYCINSPATGFVDSLSDYSPIQMGSCQLEWLCDCNFCAVKFCPSLWFYRHPMHPSQKKPSFFICCTMLWMTTHHSNCPLQHFICPVVRFVLILPMKCLWQIALSCFL